MTQLPWKVLCGKNAIVTGGSKGIGYSMACTLAEAGANVMIVSRHGDESKKAAEKLERICSRATSFVADVTVKAEVEKMIEYALEAYGRIDLLVNNAGTNIRKPILEFTEEEWDRVITTNLKGVFLVAQAVGKVMVQQKSGKIINIASVAGVRGRPFLGAYCASKGGVIQLTKVMALEWAKDNVQVNAIAPTYVETSLTADWIKQNREEILKRIPMGRLATFQDLSGVLLFLASEASDFITGQTIFVDGGATA